jgi:hypothetical protein
VSQSNAPGASPGRGPLVVVLAIIGVLGIIGGILYVSGAANSIHFIDGSVYKGHHQVRAIVSFVVGIAFLVMAYFAKTRPASVGRASATGTTSAAGPSSTVRPSSPAGPANTADPTSTAGPASAAGPSSPAGPAGPAGPASGSGGPTTPSGT